jgi:hypothetical protein
MVTNSRKTFSAWRYSLSLYLFCICIILFRLHTINPSLSVFWVLKWYEVHYPIVLLLWKLSYCKKILIQHPYTFHSLTALAGVNKHWLVSLALTKAFISTPVTNLLSHICGEMKTVGETIHKLNKSVLITFDFSLGVVEQTRPFVEPCILETFSLTTMQTTIQCFNAILLHPVSCTFPHELLKHYTVNTQHVGIMIILYICIREIPKSFLRRLLAILWRIPQFLQTNCRDGTFKWIVTEWIPNPYFFL